MDVGFEHIAIKEAQRLSIPVIGVVDTNHDPDGITYPIPGNDDASGAIALYAAAFADALLEGRSQLQKSCFPKLPKKKNLQRVDENRKQNALLLADKPCSQKSLKFREETMAEISASDVMKLRGMTGAPMMDCKKALIATNGDMEAAAEHMRKTGLLKADKKSDRITAEGLIELLVSDDKKSAVLLELNCETDFVARDENFQKLAKTWCLLL